MHALFKDSLDTPFVFFYIVIKSCNPNPGLQPNIKIIMNAIYRNNFTPPMAVRPLM